MFIDVAESAGVGRDLSVLISKEAIAARHVPGTRGRAPPPGVDPKTVDAPLVRVVGDDVVGYNVVRRVDFGDLNASNNEVVHNIITNSGAGCACNAFGVFLLVGNHRSWNRQHVPRQLLVRESGRQYFDQRRWLHRDVEHDREPELHQRLGDGLHAPLRKRLRWVRRIRNTWRWRRARSRRLEWHDHDRQLDVLDNVCDHHHGADHHYGADHDGSEHDHDHHHDPESADVDGPPGDLRVGGRRFDADHDLGLVDGDCADRVYLPVAALCPVGRLFRDRERDRHRLPADHERRRHGRASRRDCVERSRLRRLQ